MCLALSDRQCKIGIGGMLKGMKEEEAKDSENRRIRRRKRKEEGITGR
jgi:hypothetical protein